jgi:superfamily II DNA or RNA helicase
MEEENTDQPVLAMPATRGYQQEMLEESLQKNIIIALDTGSGKTHIAVLRMKYEMEREPTKVRNHYRTSRYLAIHSYLAFLVLCTNYSLVRTTETCHRDPHTCLCRDNLWRQ